jgi:glycosyltransferase involved in cell wall biosynthesis
MQRFCPVPATDKPASFVVGNVKTLKYCYGIDTLIRAFALVHQHHPQTDMRLLIAGTGPDRDQLINLCEELGIRQLVDFLGYIPNQELPKLYAKFDVSVSLSREESFGVVAVEAMSCGCPVVTSDAEGFCEVVENKVTGFVVPKDNLEAAAEAIERFIDNPQLRAQMGAAARQRVADLYDWERNVDTMMDIYKRVISS